jgi:hypothetical protein
MPRLISLILEEDSNHQNPNRPRLSIGVLGEGE